MFAPTTTFITETDPVGEITLTMECAHQILCNDQYMFWKENVPLSYSRMRELFIQAIKQFVSDIKFYGLHCLRSGGATAAC
jgi:hypothetical protein